VKDCNSLPASARSTDHVKVVARLRWCFRVYGFHELLKDNERGQAADAAAVEGEQLELSVDHVHMVVASAVAITLLNYTTLESGSGGEIERS
jgi:hypothetical protein